jgi:hypothetical protein
MNNKKGYVPVNRYDEWSDWDSMHDWEQFVAAFNKEHRPKTRLRDYAIRNLTVGFVVGVVIALWLK